MSQYPHDEFDDVAPYQSDEMGKHRTPGAVAPRAAGPFKWIALLAVAVGVILIFAYVVIPFFSDDEDPVADEDTSTEDDDANGDPDDEDDSEGNGEDEEGAEDEDEVDVSELPVVRGVNAGAPTGSANHLQETLQDAGFNAYDDPVNWDFDEWGEVNTPAVWFPTEEEQEHAEEIAVELGIDNVSVNPNWSTIVVVVGPDYELPEDYEVGGGE